MTKQIVGTLSNVSEALLSRREPGEGPLTMTGRGLTVQLMKESSQSLSSRTLDISYGAEASAGVSLPRLANHTADDAPPIQAKVQHAIKCLVDLSSG